MRMQAGFKILAKFRRNFTNFGNFGGGRKKNPKIRYTLIHVLYNFGLIFSIVYIVYYSIQYMCSHKSY
jgi:hypothetical protein